VSRHIFTKEECSKGGRKGFRNAVFSLQERYSFDFNVAVCLLLKRIGWRGKKDA